eukprot:356667_1
MRISIDPSIYSQNLTVKLKSFDSRIFPDIYQNFYSDSRDYDQMIDAIFALRKILFDNENMFIDDHPLKNGSIQEWVRDYIWKNTVSANHAVGTVSMGSDEIFPVDTECSLKGVNNLRIIDISIWPESTNSGTMSLSHMIGEKCVKYIIDHYKDDEANWWNENQIYVIIAIIVIICMMIIIFVGIKRCHNNKLQNDKQTESIPLIKNK